MKTLKKIIISLIFMTVKNIGFAQTSPLNNLSVPSSQNNIDSSTINIAVKLTEAQRLVLYQQYMAQKQSGDSLIMFDGTTRIAKPKKKIELDKH